MDKNEFREMYTDMWNGIPTPLKVVWSLAALGGVAIAGTAVWGFITVVLHFTQ